MDVEQWRVAVARDRERRNSGSTMQTTSWAICILQRSGLVQAWVGQNVTFCFETACNRYISPGSRRTHFPSLGKLFSCSR